MVNRAGHEGACLQAQAAICAERAGRFDAFSDALFDDGPKDPAGLVALAATLGLDASAFRACLESPQSRRRLDADVAAAIAHGVSGTPTIVVNGTKHTGRLSPDDLGCLARLRPAAPATL
jgi:2-hydroxychromene-2-carboxylate isomerase